MRKVFGAILRRVADVVAPSPTEDIAEGRGFPSVYEGDGVAHGPARVSKRAIGSALVDSLKEDLETLGLVYDPAEKYDAKLIAAMAGHKRADVILERCNIARTQLVDAVRRYIRACADAAGAQLALEDVVVQRFAKENNEPIDKVRAAVTERVVEADAAKGKAFVALELAFNKAADLSDDNGWGGEKPKRPSA